MIIITEVGWPPTQTNANLSAEVWKNSSQTPLEAHGGCLSGSTEIVI